MADRLSLALPIDTARLFDSTVSQAQIDADTFINSGDDPDTLASMIEDAEGEFRRLTDDAMQISRVGVAGQRETFEQPTYKLSGHQLTKGTFTGTWTDYLPEEKSIMLDHDHLLPFDSAAGDSVYLYHGLAESGNTWEDVTDKEGEMWEIVNPVSGRFMFSPLEIADTILTGRPTARGSVPEFIRRMRFAISYRYGGLGGDRGRATATDLDTSLTDTETGSVAVTDGARFPTGTEGGAITVLVGDEYLSVVPDPANDSMDIKQRGIRGTTKASHSSGDRVQYTPPAVRKAVAARAGMTLVQSGRYRGFLPDTEDDLDSSDVIDELEGIWTTTVGALSG